ncbi:hypothetical protein BLNAU_577 [Blattamonas nauphoetae]|uniref:Uncharacterized protein n=1 Tax=Blattamonas nauphoetae TaxID=2049346 RepID=A0ABQ9YLM7_9EUKA|nr:hypothetical protein BLNAU_577 [Blattamonas nauphoetae]
MLLFCFTTIVSVHCILTEQSIDDPSSLFSTISRNITSPNADYHSALLIFEMLASQGYVPAQRMAGFFHGTGLGFGNGYYRNTSSIDWGKMLMYNTFAAKYNTDAMKSLAYHYSDGIHESIGGPINDCGFAAQLYSELAEKTLKESLDLYTSPEVETAWLFVIPPCRAGVFEEPCLNVSQLRKDSEKYITSHSSIADLFELTSSHTPQGKALVGKIQYLSNPEKAYALLNEVADEVPEARGTLGIMHLYGLGIEQSIADARAHFHAGEMADDLVSISGLAFIEFMEGNYEEAKKYALRAASRSSQHGSYLYGLLDILAPPPLHQNIVEGEAYLEAASISGHLTARLHYANLLIEKRADLLLNNGKGISGQGQNIHALRLAGDVGFEPGDHFCKRSLTLLKSIISISPSQNKRITQAMKGSFEAYKRGLFEKHSIAQIEWMRRGKEEQARNSEDTDKNKLPSRTDEETESEISVEDRTQQVHVDKQREKIVTHQYTDEEKDAWRSVLDLAALADTGNVYANEALGELCLHSVGGGAPCLGGMRSVDYLLQAVRLGSQPAHILLGDYLYSIGLNKLAALMYSYGIRQYNPFRREVVMPFRPKEFDIEFPYESSLKSDQDPDVRDFVGMRDQINPKHGTLENLKRSVTDIKQGGISQVFGMALSLFKKGRDWIMSFGLRSVHAQGRLIGEADASFKLALMVARGDIGVRFGADVIQTPFDPTKNMTEYTKSLAEKRRKERASQQTKNNTKPNDQEHKTEQHEEPEQDSTQTDEAIRERRRKRMRRMERDRKAAGKSLANELGEFLVELDLPAPDELSLIDMSEYDEENNSTQAPEDKCPRGSECFKTLQEKRRQIIRQLFGMSSTKMHTANDLFLFLYYAIVFRYVTEFSEDGGPFATSTLILIASVILFFISALIIIAKKCDTVEEEPEDEGNMAELNPAPFLDDQQEPDDPNLQEEEEGEEAQSDEPSFQELEDGTVEVVAPVIQDPDQDDIHHREVDLSDVNEQTTLVEPTEKVSDETTKDHED